MRIGVHLQALRPGAIGGNEAYVRQLVRLLPEVDPAVRLVLFCAHYNAVTFAGDRNAELHVLDAAGFDALDAARLRSHRLDAWFCPLLVLEPHEPGLPAVVTIPDLQHLAYPQFFADRVLDWRREHYPRTARRADAILTYSHFSRREIIDAFDVERSRVHAIHLDAAPAFSRRTGSERRCSGDSDARSERRRSDELQRRYALPEDFVLYPANDWPHKNHDALFEALLVDEPRVDPRLHVVLTGANVDGGARWNEAVRARGLEQRVHHLGYVPDDDLPELYARARALVMPSLFEGFGLPVIEAMRSGCPVVCSDATSLPEIAADAAEYFDPRDPRQLAAAIGRLTPDRATELAAAGRRRAQAFDWRRTARATLDVMRGVVDRAATPAITPAAREPPLISIITPSLQQGRFIERTLKSVLEQDYPRVEHWVIDGGSTDGTLEILERYRRAYPGVLDYISEPDRGQAEAVNKGIARARGDIVGWINSDDTYEPGSFAAVARAFAENPACDLVYGRAAFVSEDDEPLAPYPTRPRFDWHALVHECYICQPTVFWRRAVTDAGPRLDEALQLALDYDFWIRLGRSFRFHFVDRRLASSRFYRETKTIRRREQVFEESFAVVKRHYGWLPISWALGRAHYRRGGNDSFLDAGPVAPATYLWAVADLARHNWSAPRRWRRVLGDLRPLVARGLSSLRRRLAPTSRQVLRLPGSCLIAEIRLDVLRRSDRSAAVDVWWAGRHLERFAINGPGTYAWRHALPSKEKPGPYKLILRSDLLRVGAARALEARAFPAVAEDGWLEQHDTLRLPPGWTDVELAFVLPACADAGAELRFSCDGQQIDVWKLGAPGTYRKRLQLPRRAALENGETQIAFTSDVAMPPDPARGETRRLAMRVRQIVDLTPRVAELPSGAELPT
jgi:glycosyltransferase involved in cell wall biosynthesis